MELYEKLDSLADKLTIVLEDKVINSKVIAQPFRVVIDSRDHPDNHHHLVSSVRITARENAMDVDEMFEHFKPLADKLAEHICELEYKYVSMPMLPESSVISKVVESAAVNTRLVRRYDMESLQSLLLFEIYLIRARKA